MNAERKMAMTALELIGYLADVWILGTYAVSVHTHKVRLFHWANAIGCVPLVTAEVQAGLWQVVLITGTFGVLGWYGVFTTRKESR